MILGLWAGEDMNFQGQGGAYDFCGWGEGGGRIFGVLAIKKRFRQILVSIQHATNNVSVEKLYFA